MKVFYVYILASRKNGTLYTGMTSDLHRRMEEHKSEQVEGFTKQYKVHTLVHVEEFECFADAAYREKCIKKWLRCWKIELIEKGNPDWRDLSGDL